MLSVFLFHYYNINEPATENILCIYIITLFKGAGYLGVDFFFTLSGFLITCILLGRQYIDLSRFYTRRVLRIAPLYLLVVAVSYFLLPIVAGYHIHLPPLVYVISFTANHFYTWHGDNYLFAITLLWSLSVEMQFYIVWGALIRYFKKHLFAGAGAFILISLIIKNIEAGNCSLYYLSATYVPDFMIGAIGAKLINEGLIDFSQIRKTIRVMMYLTTAAIIVFTPVLNKFFAWEMCSNCICSFSFLAIILDQVSSYSLVNLGKVRAINYLGKISYGIYCFQGFVLPAYAKLLIGHLAIPWPLVSVFIVPAALFIITSIIAAISYRYFESYFLGPKPEA